MDVRDILTLHQWVETWVPAVLEHYIPLRDVLANNAQQSTAQPVARPLDDLVLHLQNVKTEELSGLQVRVLSYLGVDRLLGKSGAYWVKKTIRSSTYDPATAHEEVNKAVSLLQQLQKQMKSFVTSVSPLGFEPDASEVTDGLFRVAVIFQDRASIENLPDLKKLASDWDEIISGVAGAVGEKPEETNIIGVSNGSVLIFLTATAAVTTILALIAKHASEVASYAIGVADQLEDLRAKKMHNAAI